MRFQTGASPDTENPARVTFTPTGDSAVEGRVSLAPLDFTTAARARSTRASACTCGSEANRRMFGVERGCPEHDYHARKCMTCGQDGYAHRPPTHPFRPAGTS